MRIKRFKCGSYGVVASSINGFTKKVEARTYAVVRSSGKRRWELFLTKEGMPPFPIAEGRTLRECLCIASQKMGWII